MDRREIEAALTDLGARLHSEGLLGELYIVGGAALALAYDARRATRDVDAIFEPKMPIYRLAAEVAAAQDLPLDWLNDAVKGLLLGEDPFAPRSFEVLGLRAQIASPEILLVLKCLSHRPGADEQDVRFLADQLGLRRADEILDLVVRVAGERRVSPAAQFFVQALFPERA